MYILESELIIEEGAPYPSQHKIPSHLEEAVALELIEQMEKEEERTKG
jgi:hypothetical protein